MRRLVGWLMVLLVGWAGATSFAAPVLVIDSAGVLLGAKGVDVGGVLYDVTFEDGTCSALYSGCDDAGDFPFDEATATVAANALLDQVMLDGPLGNFDSNPALTRGCTQQTSFCQLRTPIATAGGLNTTPDSVVRVAAVNSPGSSGDGVGVDCCASQTLNNPIATFVVWTLAAPGAASMPEPGSLGLVACAMFSAFVAGRRSCSR